MAFSQALYYPSIDIQDEAWLKTSLLYWDSIRTIVPETIESPYSLESARILQESDFLVPLRVNSDMEEIRGLTENVRAYLRTTEGGELLVSGSDKRRRPIHTEKLSTDMVRLPELMNIGKLMRTHEIFLELKKQQLAKPSSRGEEWIQVDQGFAYFYMTLLANRLAERIGAALLTPLPVAERLSITARLDSRLNHIFPWGFNEGQYKPFQSDREHEADGPRREMPRTLAPGLLAQLVIQQVGVEPNTPIDDLLRFRENHKDELSLFRTKVEELTSAVEGDIPAEALRQRILDIHSSEVLPAISNLKNALKGQGIRWVGDSLLKIAFISAGSSTMLATAGLDIPTALLAGSGLSLIVSGTLYNLDKKESLRSNPYSYLLSLEREFG